LNAQGIVTTLGVEDAEVQVGMLRVRARISDLVPLGGGIEEEPEAPRARRRKTVSGPVEPMQPSTLKAAPPLPPSPGMEIDLRGQRAEDALYALDRYLDSAFLSGMPFVRIIHGKGTGKLRQAVREALGQNPNVKSFESGGEKEGGDGVTVAKLAVS